MFYSWDTTCKTVGHQCNNEKLIIEINFSAIMHSLIFNYHNFGDMIGICYHNKNSNVLNQTGWQ